MFSKVIGFSLVYLLTILNFFVFLSPITFILLGRYLIRMHNVDNYLFSIFFLSLSLINFLMLIFLFFDFLFGYSVSKILKKCRNCCKSKDYNFLVGIFEDVKNRYNFKKINLYISPSKDINAYAVGSLRKKAIILTRGILEHYLSTDKENFLENIKGILGHEMSHIVNDDYFTALLLIVNERALNFVSRITLFLFNILIRFFSAIPFLGHYISYVISTIYKLFYFFITIFYKRVFLPIYSFIQLQISKSIEYRADMQGAMVVGGYAMSRSLSILGNSSYFSIFSSHPSTKNRVKYVKDFKKSNRIRALFFSKLLVLFSFLILFLLCYYSYKMANLNSLINDFNSVLIYIENKIISIKNYLVNFINNF